MDIKDLKLKIQNKTLDDSVLILKYSDNKFLSVQYMTEIAKIKNKTINYIRSVNQINDDDIFEDRSNYLYVLDVEKLDSNISSDIKNLIIICKEVPENLSIDYTEMPKIVSWQIEDYVKMRLPGLDDKEIKWLCEITSYDIYRLDKECSKLDIFSAPSQKIIFRELNAENAYVDLNPLTIFNFTNAILKKDYNMIKSILMDLETIDVEGTGVVTILIKQFKNLIDIQINPKNTAQSLGMNPKQFAAIKWNVNKFTNSQLIKIFEFLTSIDFRIKNGDLAFKDNADHLTLNNMLVDYITVNLLNFCAK